MKYKLARLNDANNSLERQWCVVFYYKHPETGSMVRFRRWISNRIKTKSGRRDKARQLINNINLKLKCGWNPYADHEKQLTNLVEAIEFALKIKSKSIGKRSRHSYNSIAGIFTDYLKTHNLDAIAVDEMNKDIAQAFCDHILLERNYSPRTYNNHVTSLKTIFNFLVKREFLNFNPFSLIDKLREPEPEITAYSNKELDKISETLPSFNYQLYVISQLIFYCFVRPAELVRLQYHDIQWEHGMILLPGSKSKNKKSAVIILPEQLKQNLKKWDLDYPDDYYLFAKDLQPGTKQIAPTRIAEAWRKYADAHKIKKNIYDFKHTGNGMAFDQGFNSRDIQLQNRHSSLDETQRYLNKFRRVASDKFKEEFKGY
ncbi:MAG: site-specific integrase [Bacteroidota bacterium]